MDITERENIVEIRLAVCCSDCFLSHHLALSLKCAINSENSSFLSLNMLLMSYQIHTTSNKLKVLIRQ